MQIQEKETKIFQPITLEITVENEQDLAHLILAFNTPIIVINKFAIDSTPTLKYDYNNVVPFDQIARIVKKHTNWFHTYQPRLPR